MNKPITPGSLVREDENLPIKHTGTPQDMIQYAIQSKASITELRELYALQKEFEADQARKAYTEAMAAFKKNPPRIIKDKLVEFPTSKGKTSYMHATLGNVCAEVIKGLAENNFMHRWDTEQPDGGQIVVTCIITHAMGHSERTTLKAGRDDSGGKNSIQQVASTVTYLQRYTLLAACGLATSEADDDAGRAGTEEIVPMTDDHQLTIDALCDEIGPTAKGTPRLTAVLKHYKVESLAEIPDSEYEEIVLKLNALKAAA